VAQLPLPPALLRLRQALGALAQVHRFLCGQHVSPTWRALSSVLDQQHAPAVGCGSGEQQPLGGKVGPGGLELEDVRHMAALAPAVVSLRDRSRPHEDVVYQLLSGSSGSATVRQPRGGSGSIEADVAGQGWSAELAQQVAGSIGHAATAADEGQGSTALADGVHSLVVDIVDPGRCVSKGTARGGIRSNLPSSKCHVISCHILIKGATRLDVSSFYSRVSG
jgi:hypothetical protein